jgi:hypothetical protein
MFRKASECAWYGIAGPNLKACGFCGDEAYFSRAHQIAHWIREHKAGAFQARRTEEH